MPNPPTGPTGPFRPVGATAIFRPTGATGATGSNRPVGGGMGATLIVRPTGPSRPPMPAPSPAPGPLQGATGAVPVGGFGGLGATRISTEVLKAPLVVSSRPDRGFLDLGRDPGLVIVPGLLADPTRSSLFDAGKPGDAVTRADDLLALRIETVNLTVTPGSPPRMSVANPDADALLILHFPPQAIAEEVFFQTASAGYEGKALAPPAPDPALAPSTNDVDSGVAPPPIRARTSAESRIVFKVPKDFSGDYTLQGVLAACEQFALNVPAHALPPGSGTGLGGLLGGVQLGAGGAIAAAVEALTAGQRAALLTNALRNLQVAGSQGLDSPTLAARDAVGASVGQAMGGDDAGRFSASRLAARLGAGGRFGGLAAAGGGMGAAGGGVRPIDDVVEPVGGLGGLGGGVFRPALPKPAEPDKHHTAIEMPWRLWIAPHQGEGFRHAAVPMTSPLTQRTELWHTRLIAQPKAPATQATEPPKPDPQRTIRAVWARTGEASDLNRPMQSDFLTTATMPRVDPLTTPFLTPMDDNDRFQIVHLSSNFSLGKSYVPAPVSTNLMMLSALGGWLDSRGQWDPPGLSVEEWAHRASMGRDHYVRVVYKGFLFPFGHAVSLVKVTERKFHNGRSGTNTRPDNAAYLRQRMFIVVRERDRDFLPDAGLMTVDGQVNLQRAFPFNQVRVLSAVTPDLDNPQDPQNLLPVVEALAPGPVPVGVEAAKLGRMMFWPCVNKKPFAFRCVGTDIDGNRVQFEVPMLFMDNSLASPRRRVNLPGSRAVLKPDRPVAEFYANWAANEFNARTDSVVQNGQSVSQPRRKARLHFQRLALAPSIKPGDTTAEMEWLEFTGVAERNNDALYARSRELMKPVFYPGVGKMQARIAAIAQLAGSPQTNALGWNPSYLRVGFDTSGAGGLPKNVGQVFVDIVPKVAFGEAAVQPEAKLDFSTQGDRSGGFVMPNLKPSVLSRATGPVSGPVASIVSGAPVAGPDMFPNSLSDLPLPLLFGCIPLGAILQAMAPDGAKMPAFASEALSAVEGFFNDLARLYGLVGQIGGQAGSIAQAAAKVLDGTAKDLLDQALALPDAAVDPVRTALQQARNAVANLVAELQALAATLPDGSWPDVSELAALLTPAKIADLTAAIDAVLATLQAASASAVAAVLPSGFVQAVKALAVQAAARTAEFQAILGLIGTAKTLFDAIEAVVEDVNILATPATLEARLADILAALDPLRAGIVATKLLDGAPRKALVDAIDLLKTVLTAGGGIAKLLENLLGDELVIRFDWKPAIDNWALPGASKEDEPLFRANDKHGFVVAVEARAKKSGGTPTVKVSCSLKHFDLVLINPAAFIELNFDKIEFSVDASAKPNVDVLLNDIKFVGPLSFVETLKDLIPLDGFSDPPYLDISAQGIDAGFSLTLPNIAVGVFSLSNLSLGAGFTVPFIGQPLSVRFNFCTREQPFNLTVSLFGGGGFFGITLDPSGVQLFEAALEFGASVSLDFGVASGGVHVMAGIYFRMEKDVASLTGYLRLGGHVRVLCLVGASLELYLGLSYTPSTGKCEGEAKLTICITVFLVDIPVTITCRREFAGSNGDPTFRQLMGRQPELSIDDEVALIDDETLYPWRDYCEAFA